MTTPASCILCSARGHHTAIDAGHVCPACAVRVRDDLGAITRLAEIAAASVEPVHGHGASNTVPASRPPLNVAALDPALTLVRLEPSDPSSAVTILECLEMHERDVRDRHHLAPYGPASARRATQDATTGHGGYWDTLATLRGVTDFLHAWHDRLLADPTWPIHDYANQLHRCARALQRWNPDHNPDHTWRIPCPTLQDDGTDCAHLLRINPTDHALIACRACGRDWEPQRLLTVAGRNADVWVDAEAAAAATGAHPATIRRWALAGRIRRHHGRYALLDVRTAAATPTPHPR